MKVLSEGAKTSAIARQTSRMFLEPVRCFMNEQIEKCTFGQDQPIAHDVGTGTDGATGTGAGDAAEEGTKVVALLQNTSRTNCTALLAIQLTYGSKKQTQGHEPDPENALLQDGKLRGGEVALRHTFSRLGDRFSSHSNCSGDSG